MKRAILSTLLLFLLLPSKPAAGADSGRAPSFALKDLNGQTIRLDQFKGKVVMLNFWATWCPPCRAEMPDLVKLQREYGGQGLQIAGITYPPERASRVRRLARELKINYPLLFGTRRVALLYGVEDILPVTVIIDREGRIRDRILGILTPEEFEQKVRPMLGQGPVVRDHGPELKEWRDYFSGQGPENKEGRDYLMIRDSLYSIPLLP